jgi:hypothetical protein
MAAHAARIPRTWWLAARLKALGGRMVLDRQLAAGTDPGTALELRCRAYELTRTRTMRKLASGVEHLIDAAEAPPSRLGAAIPVQRAEVRAARMELLRLAAVLSRTPRPGVRGVAAAAMLLTDGGGPVFSPHPPGALREAAIRAAANVEAG